MKLGQSATHRRRFSAADVENYRRLVGHACAPEIVPEPMINALFSYLLGVKLPGRGTNYLKQSSRFHGIAAPGDELLARVEITGMRPDKQLVDLETTCHLADGSLIAEGRALVLVRDVEAGPTQTADQHRDTILAQQDKQQDKHDERL